MDISQGMAAIESLLMPTIQKATDWSMKAAWGLFSVQAFYFLIIRFTKI